MSNELFTGGNALTGLKKLTQEPVINNVSLLFKCFTLLVVIFWASTATADTLNDKKLFCEKKASIKTELNDKLQLDPEYNKAMLSIAQLPEFLQIKNDISKIDKINSINFDSGRDELYETSEGKCYWQVSVYLNREDENRMSLWHTFLVDRNGKVESVNNLEGDYISLSQWRSSNILK